MPSRDYGPSPRLVSEISSPALTDSRMKMIDDAETFAVPVPRDEKRWERVRDRDSQDANKILEESEYDGYNLAHKTINAYDDKTGALTQSDRTQYLHGTEASKLGTVPEYRDTRTYHYHDDGRLFMETQSTKYVDYKGAVNDTTGFDHMTIHVYPGETYENEITGNMAIITHADDGSVRKKERYDRDHVFTDEYDERGRPTKSTYVYEGRVSHITEYTYSDNSDGTYSCTEVEKKFDKKGVEQATSTTHSLFRADNKPLSRVDEENNLYSFMTYDKRGNLSRSVERTKLDHSLDVSPQYVIREYEYDGLGKVTHKSKKIWKEPQGINN